MLLYAVCEHFKRCHLEASHYQPPFNNVGRKMGPELANILQLHGKIQGLLVLGMGLLSPPYLGEDSTTS